MDLELVKKFIELAESKGVSALKYEDDDIKISVDYSQSVQIQQHTPVQTHAVMPVEVEASNNSTSGSEFHEIKSPFVGTFYGQPAPGKPSYVKIGDRIGKGQTLCILEAMKIMNEIESDVSGEIVEICVENESLVEYGQVLFKVRA